MSKVNPMLADDSKPVDDPPEDEEDDGWCGSECDLVEGETYFHGGKSGFCEATGCIALQQIEGGIFLYIMGRGRVELGDYLKSAGKAKISTVK